MPRCRKKPSVYEIHDDKSETDFHQTSVRNDNKQEHSRAHTYPHTAHPHHCTSHFKEPIAGPSGLAATRRHSLRHHPNQTYLSASSSSSGSCGRRISVGHDSDSSSSASDYPPYRAQNIPVSMFYWLARAPGRFIDFIGTILSFLLFSLPLDVLLLRRDHYHLRRKALTVAGLTLLGLGCWFFIPTLIQPCSGSMHTAASGVNLAKIQEQLMDIQKQLAEKEARWKETLLKEIGSLQNEEKITSGLKEELSNWLQEYLSAGASPSAEGTVLWPELRVALESLEEKLVQRMASPQDVHKTVQEAVNQYRADGIGMADYALIYSGGKVIASHYVKPYCPQSLQFPEEGPTAVIQPEVYPGKCWAFRGSYGSVTIALSRSVRITHVTMEHLPRSLSPTGQIDTAPQDFAVYGIDHIEQQQEGVFLGKFAYSKDGDPIQTFELKDSVKDFYPAVGLRILTNWGNSAYTCVYRFRVHGVPRTA